MGSTIAKGCEACAMECRKARHEFRNATMRGTIQETNDFLGHRTVIKCRCDPLSLVHEQFPLPDRRAAAANNVVCLRHRCVLIFILRCSNQGNLLHQAMLPAIGTMAFLSHSRSVHLPFPYDKGSGGTRAAGQKLRRYLPLVKTVAANH